MDDSNLPPTIPSPSHFPDALLIATRYGGLPPAWRDSTLDLLHYVAVGRRWEDSARSGWRRVADLTAQLESTAKQRDEAREQREAADATLYARLTAKQAELDDALAELRELDEQRGADARVAQCKLAAKVTEASLTRQSLAEARAECYDLRRELEEAREQLVEREASIAAHIRSANSTLANYSRVCCELDTLRAELRKLGGAQ